MDVRTYGCAHVCVGMHVCARARICVNQCIVQEQGFLKFYSDTWLKDDANALTAASSSFSGSNASAFLIWLPLLTTP